MENNVKRLEEIAKELKSVQSAKCRLAKQQLRKDYDESMKEILAKEESLKRERRSLLEPKLTVTTMTAEQINELEYTEVVRAIKSIQSKKCLSQYDADQTEYKKALQIELLLKERREQIQPSERRIVTVTRINALIELVAEQPTAKVNKEWILEQLQKLTAIE